MAGQPTLKIISDTEADIIKGDARLKIRGGAAARIIAAYRHCLTHKDSGKADAALYLWGLLDGMHHSALTQAEEIINRRKERQE